MISIIIPLSNKVIGNDTMLEALSEVKRQTKKYSLEQLKAYREKVIKDNEKEARYAFPYVYDPSNPRPNYLEFRSVEEESTGRSR